jgi:hypothetical protein
MKHIHHYIIVHSIVALFGFSFSECWAVVKDTEEEGPVLPEIWIKAGPRERLKATRAAEVDGDRLLVERINGLQIDSETTIRDLVAENDEIAGAVSATLVGAVSTESPEYLDDGRVRVVRAVKIREVVDNLNRVIKGRRLDDGSFLTDSDKIKTERKTNDKTLEVMGNSALRGSLGHQKIMAKRAAEMDAYRNLAARIMGEQIDSETTVKDMALENDEVIKSLSNIVKGANPTKISFKPTGDCEVTMEVKIKDLVRSLKIKTVANTKKIQLNDEDNIRTYTAKGVGSMQDALHADSESSESGNSTYEEFEVNIKEVIQSGPLIQ